MKNPLQLPTMRTNEYKDFNWQMDLFHPNRDFCLNYSGFTIIELMVVLAIVGLLSMVALPAYQDYVARLDESTAETDIATIGLSITDYDLSNGKLPDSMATIEMGGLRDPWGNPYQYLNHATANNGQKRKDKNLVPINSDYNLYSMGVDGESVSPLTAQKSRDDIIRAKR